MAFTLNPLPHRNSLRQPPNSRTFGMRADRAPRLTSDSALHAKPPANIFDLGGFVRSGRLLRAPCPASDQCLEKTSDISS